MTRPKIEYMWPFFIVSSVEQRYVNEFTWRLNEGNVKRHSLERLDSFVDTIAGKRITFKDLTADNGQDPTPIPF